MNTRFACNVCNASRTAVAVSSYPRNAGRALDGSPISACREGPARKVPVVQASSYDPRADPRIRAVRSTDPIIPSKDLDESCVPGRDKRLKWTQQPSGT